MGRRCSGCGKMASIDDSADVEVQDEELNEDGTVTFTVHVPLMSSCCGEEMAYADLEGEIDLADGHECMGKCSDCDGTGVVECEECGGEGTIEVSGEVDGEIEHDTVDCPSCNGSGKVECGGCGGDGLELVPHGSSVFDTDSLDIEAVFTSEQSDKTGRKGFKATYYGAEVTASVKCETCGEEVSASTTVTEKASYFEEA